MHVQQASLITELGQSIYGSCHLVYWAFYIASQLITKVLTLHLSDTFEQWPIRDISIYVSLIST